MSTQLFSLLVILALASTLSVAELSPEQPKPMNYSFTLPLIHRDSSNSPWYDSKLSQHDRVKYAIARSIVRSKLLFTKKLDQFGSVDENLTEIISAKGEYFINISIGTPPFPFLAMLDSCSNDNWLEGDFYNDDDDYSQKTSLYDPETSSTNDYPTPPINQIGSSDIITIGNFKLPNLVFNVWYTTQGAFSSIGSGVIGLVIDNEKIGGTKLQISIGGKFSYCLTPLATNGSKSSEINFGESAVVSGDDVVSTPIVKISDDSPHRTINLTLEAITVGEKKVMWNTTPSVGNIIMDFGMTLLMLQSSFYDAVESEIRSQVNATKVDDPSGQLKLCYNSNGFKPPKLFMNFSGANVTLNDYNVWVAMSDNIMCFAAAPAKITIYGNLAQRNFLIGYDMNKATIAFKPTDCSK